MNAPNGNTPTNNGGGPLLTIILGVIVVIGAVVLVLTLNTSTADKAGAGADSTTVVGNADKKEKAEPKKADAPKEDMEALPLELPNPVFAGTPKDIPAGARMQKPTGKSRDPFMAPKGAVNLALNKKVTSSDANPIIGSLDLVTDGDKEALDGRWVELAPGVQWVQIDLGEESEMFAIVLWHLHAEPQIYRDVVIKASSDPDMIKDVKVLYNSDFDNSAGQGKGEDYEYFEDYEGKLFDTKGAKARYLRFYSNGSTSDDQNRYTEIEVWGRPVKK